MRRDELNELRRANLRALLRRLHERLESWVAVAHVVGFRRAVVVTFFRGEHEGNMALARGIARAAGLSLEDALAGKPIPGASLRDVPTASPRRPGRRAS